MATQGILLPVELQIRNLLDITKLLKLFAGNNILAESLGGKKIDSELNKILQRLELVLAKAQSAFTTLSNFSSVEKDVALIELGLNRINQDIANLSFKDLKIPDDVQGQIEALLGRINELNNSLLTFKGTQKAKLVNNLEFMANLKVAEPAQAAKMLEKGYDELFQAVNKGMGKVNAELALKAAAFKLLQEVISQNSAGKAAMTQWGALGFILEAFKALPKDDSKKSETQKLMDSIMNYTAGDNKTGGEFASFKKGAIGLNSFLKAILSRFEFSPLEMNEIRLRLSELAKELSKTAQTSVTDVLKRMSTDENLAKNILFGSKADIVSNLKDGYKEQLAALEKLKTELDNYTVRLKAYENVQNAFNGPNNDIAAKAREIAKALLEPTAALEKYQLALLLAVINNPALAANFGSAASLIRTMVSTIDSGRAKLTEMDLTINKMLGVSNFINRYIGVYAIVRKVSLAIRSAMNNIKELDLSITNIAVVTNMSLEDLWGKIGEYTAMAQEYGVATKDVYTVSQLFYQQGLLTSQVMSLTTETLKMAKISGMGYESAANAMTVAVRAFRIEMQDALQVTDTYSALAAKFAVSSAEIANAMEKTASSAANVGMSLQSTSAFMSVMIQTTRESAQNIGSALKSIISRYGEMKASPSTLLNVDGEEVAFNKVDTALKSVGISIKDASGQFRDFDDVILELALKWNSLDNNTQRYIATIMAGNRQQSRFIALVSNYDELSRAMDVANTSENASIVQVGKTMDSLETKTNQLKNAFSLLYLDLHLEEGLKGAYDWLTRIVTTIGKLGMLKGVLPTLATIINAGFGTKSLINMGIDNYKRKRFDLLQEVDANTSKALNKIELLIKQIELPRDIPINTLVNDTELRNVEARIEALKGSLVTSNNILQSQPITLIPVLNTPTTAALPVSVNDFYAKLYAALALGNLNTAEGRANTLAEMGVALDSSIYGPLSAMMSSFSGAANAANEMAAMFANATGQVMAAASTVESGAETVTTSATEEAASRSENNNTISTNSGAIANNTIVVSENSAALGLLPNAIAGAVNSLGLLGLPAGQFANSFALLLPPISMAGMAISGAIDGINVPALILTNSLMAVQPPLNAMSTALIAVRQGADGASYALVHLGNSASAPTNHPLGLPGASNLPPIHTDEGGELGKSHWYSKFFSKNEETGKTEFTRTGMAAMSLTTGFARMLAPIITAAGASIKDKDNDLWEGSKIVTGFGNGLSGAATGALLGMAAGPWGALIGAIGGFVLTGASAIFDGFNYDITERIANLKQEAKEASDESLKSLAKVIDLSSTLDNLKNLKNLMYNSSEDMKNYQEAVASAADSYPELISSYDDAGNAIIDLTSAEAALSLARLEGAISARKAAIKELEVAKTLLEVYTLPTVDENLIKRKTFSEYLNLVTLPGATTESIINGMSKITDNSWMLRYGWEISGIATNNNNNNNNDFTTTIPKTIALDYLNSIEEWFTKNKEALSLPDIENVIGKINGQWTVLLALSALAFIDSQEAKLQSKILNLTLLVNSAVGIESLLLLLDVDTNLSLANLTLIETSKNFLGLFNETLLSKLDTNKYTDLDDWKNAEGSDYLNTVIELYSKFKEWYNNLSDGFKEAFALIDFTEYKSAKEIVDKFGITDEDLITGLLNEFIKRNLGNRDRILKTIYSDEGKGWNLNNALAGLEKFTLAGNKNQALDIAYKFRDLEEKPASIISKYADYFTDQLVSINKLADDGYEALAQSRLDTLSSLADALNQISDSNIQNDLFKTITSIDLSSFSSITDAYSYILQYGKQKNKAAEVAGILALLKLAEQNLIYNVNTLAQELTTTITTAAKDIDSLLTTNKSGLTFDKAIESFNKISAAYDDITNFDLIFTFDTALGKYVYTADGLKKALAQKEKDLYQKSDELGDAAKVYTEQITSKDKSGKIQLKRNFDFLPDKPEAEQTSVFKDNDSLMLALKNNNIINDQTSPEILNAYETLVHGYISLTEFINRSQESFEQYIKNYAQNVLNDANAAEVLLENFQLNKKNLLYGAIDWGKLALGTDYTGTNKTLMQSLMDELGFKQARRPGENGQVKRGWILNNKFFDELTPETVIQAYLDETYKDNEIAKKAAEAAIKGQIAKSKSDLISTAIAEVLNGTGKILSDTTITLIQSRSDLTITDGVITAGNNFVLTALDLYKTYSSTLLSLADKNSAYSTILEKQFELPTLAITALSSAASMDLSTLTDTFTKFGLELAQWYNGELWLNGLEAAMKTDAFGKTTITDWDMFLTTTGISLSDEVLGSFEYQNAYSSYVDGMITLNTQTIDLIKKSYDNAFSTITEWKPVNVVKLAQNEALVEKLTKNNAAIIDGGLLIVKDAIEYAKNTSELFVALSSADTSWLYENTGWTKADIAKNWKNAQTVITEVLDTWTGISEGISSLNTDNISTLVEKGNFNLGDLTNEVFTKIGDTYALSIDGYANYLAQLIGGVLNYSELKDGDLKKKVDDALTKAKTAITNNITGLDWEKVLSGTATLSENTDFINGLQKSLASLGMALSTFYVDGVLDVNALIGTLQQKADLNEIDAEIAERIINHLSTTVATVRDTVFDEISSGFNLLTEGTTSQVDINKFVQRYNKILQSSLAAGTANTLFDYDEVLHTWTLTTEALNTYNENQRAILKNMGMSDDSITQYIKDQTRELLTSQLDITSILDDSDKLALVDAANALARTIEKYLALGNKITNELGEMGLDAIVLTLYKGGEAGVKILLQLKGEDVTSDEIAAVYNAQMNRLRTAMESLESGAGTIVSGIAAEIATTSDGIKTQDLPDGSVVITAVSSMVDVYSNIYKQMSATAEKTTAELNSTFAKLLTAKDQGNIDAISALGDAMGMNYETLGNLIAQYGKGAWSSLEFMMQHQFSAGLESLGNGQVRIVDWNKFAGTMDWKIGGEAYMEAYSAYNDSLLELDRKAGKTIVEQIKNVADAQTGDKINITYLTEAVEGGSEAVNAALLGMGAEVKNGILTIKDGARVGDIVATLANMAKNSGQAITSELAELADAVEEFIDNIVSLIKSGITGGLKISEANSLKEWAKTYAGIEDLDFTRTAEGLQLSEQSAIALYAALKRVDSVKASLVFDELSDSLAKNNDNFKSVSGLMGHIKKLSTGIYQADGKTSKARLAQYEAELSVAKEILAVRSTQEDDSFNFMSNKIPAAQNNPLNYAKNWTLALQSIRDAFSVKKGGKTGFIDYEDWYNIATEINNMAAVTGKEIKLGSLTFKGDLESASAAIQAGAESLTTVDTGDLKVNLASVGIGIKSGADALSSGVTEGILGVAKAQVKALDGIIAMLELIVAMEQLGDIDTEGNGIDLTDLFEVTYDENGNPNGHNMDKFSADYKKWVANIKDQIDEKSANYNKDLANAVNGIRIDGHALVDMLDWTPGQFTDPANANVAKAYAAMLDAFNKAALSGNYDLDNIQLSVLQVLTESGFDDTVTLDIGDMTYVISAGTMTTIDWTDTDTDAILTDLAKKYNNDKKKARDELTTWIQLYGTGELEGETQLHYVLLVKKKITMEDGKVISVVVGGKTYNTTNSSKIELNAAVNAAVLEDFGYDVTNWKIVDPEKGTVEVETKIGNKTIKVKSEKGLVRLLSEDGLREYKNQAEFLEGEYYQWLEDTTGKSREGLYKSKEEWQWGEYKIRATITPKVTLDGADVDLSVSSKLRDKVLDALLKEELNWSLDGTGNYKISVGGTTISLAAADVEVDGKPDLSKIIASIKTQFLGEDLGLQENITKGVLGALKDGIELKVSKETTEADIKEILDAITNLKQEKPVDISVELAANNNTDKILLAIDNIKDGTAYVDIYERYHEADKSLSTIPKGNNNGIHGSTPYPIDGNIDATGTIGLAKSKGTLMGELGPELVVSNGRYFVAGLNGPEMVNLADDAIVFNHLQTKSLLEKGMSAGRGKAVTNEYNAVAFATGNINGGPAMASASAALSALKQLRAQWQALAGLSAKDLAGKGGGGGGGGGDPKPFIKELEKWYNWLLEIAQLEKEINYEEALRNRIASDFNPNGLKYYESLRRTLKDINREIATQLDLLESQLAYFEKRRAEMNSASNPFTALYTFDENGQLKYQPGALERLSLISGRNNEGKPYYTAEEQYKAIVAMNSKFAEFMKYDSSGNEIKPDDYTAMVQAFWDKIDADKEEGLSLHDSLEDLKTNIQNNLLKQNELLKEIEDNLISVENRVLKAMEDAAQREIDELSKLKDALQKTNEAFIKGLTDLLNLERKMYESLESEKDLETKRRRLSILQRSGGSAAEISSLLLEIDSSALDLYFTKLQEQIDLLQEASDNQIAKLELLIDLMTESLEYLKEHGLLWNQVYEVMALTPEDITTYITTHDSLFWSKSLVGFEQEARLVLFEAEQWKAFTNDGLFGNIQGLLTEIANEVVEERKKEKEAEALRAAAASSNLGNGDAAQVSAAPTTAALKSNTPKSYTYNGLTYSSYILAKNARENDARAFENSAVSADKAGLRDNARALRASALARRSAPIIPHYNKGGMDYTTGLAMLHGTQQKPEAILNAEQTKILRDNILSSKPDSLISLLKSYNEAYHSLASSAYDSISDNSNNVIIEHATVNVNVDKLADKYDAAKAGDDIMREMLNIARKTGAQNRVRR